MHCIPARVVWVAVVASDLTGFSTMEPLLLWVKT